MTERRVFMSVNMYNYVLCNTQFIMIDNNWGEIHRQNMHFI